MLTVIEVVLVGGKDDQELLRTVITIEIVIDVTDRLSFVTVIFQSLTSVGRFYHFLGVLPVSGSS